MPLAFLFETNKSVAQYLSPDLEMNVEEFITNKSPVKNHFAVNDYYLLPQQVNNKFGFLNIASGDTVIAFQYDSVDYFSHGIAAVKLNGKWGFVNKYGKQIIP